MSRNEWNIWYMENFGTDSFRQKVWKQNPWLRHWHLDYVKRDDIVFTTPQKEYLMQNVSLAHNVPGFGVVYMDDLYGPVLKKQEGINPMNTAYTPTMATPQVWGSKMPSGDLSITLSPAATASVSSKTDIQQQRDHLLARHQEVLRSFDAYYGKIHEMLRKTFSLEVNNTPKTSRELIAAIKAGTYKLDDRIADLQDKGNQYDEAMDEEYIGGMFAAITFDGPTPDRTGYDKAVAEFRGMLKDAKDTIIVKDPDTGLAAIQALEAWTPTTKAN